MGAPWTCRGAPTSISGELRCGAGAPSSSDEEESQGQLSAVTACCEAADTREGWAASGGGIPQKASPAWAVPQTPFMGLSNRSRTGASMALVGEPLSERV